MLFETHIRQLAEGASLKVYEANERHAKILFKMESGRTQTIWVLPFGDVWEFSVQSAIRYDNLDSFPQWLLATLMTQNSKNKRAYWCIETLSGQHVLSAMLNFPASVLNSVEFSKICLAVVHEVEVLEQAFISALGGANRVK